LEDGFGVGRMTQRKFELDAQASETPEEPVSPPVSATAPAEPADSAPAPSGEKLLQRQLLWLRERSRFESQQAKEREPK
jgi:hypothetical protein